jgi:peptide/nickel transport system substrate-binding protein
MNHSIIRTAVVSAALLLLVSACAGASKPGPNSQAVDANGTFKLNLATDPGTISPYKTTLGGARQVFKFGYDTLVSQTPDGKTVPYLAEKWTVTPSEVTYTLRKGIKCDDGTDLKASDVAAAFDNIKGPKTLSPWRSLTVPFDYSVSANDPNRTVSIKTAKPFGMLARGAGSLAIVCPSGLSNADSLDHNFGGTGAYTVKEYVAGDHYTFEKRPDYNWGPNGATTADMPKTIVVAFVANESTSASQLLTGEINAAQITGPDRARLEKAAGIKKVDVPQIQAELDLNEAAGRPLADTAVRKALAASLDRKAVTQIVTEGRGTVTKNLVALTPVLCPGDETTGALPDYNLEGAKRILDDAGWRLSSGSDVRSKDGKTLQLTAIYKPEGTPPASAMEYVANQWKKIGVGTTLVAVTNTAFSERMYTTMNYDVSYTYLNLEMPFMMTAFHGGPTPTEHGRNSGSTENAKFNSLSAEALASEGDACDLWKAAHVALLKSVDVIPLAAGSRPFYVRGGELTAVGLHAIPTSFRLYK